MGDRDPITCHVLDTHNGNPAAGLTCSLQLISVNDENTSRGVVGTAQQTHKGYQGVTDSDGRIKVWQRVDPGGETVSETMNAWAAQGSEEVGVRLVWSLRFMHIDRWYTARGVDTCFWPEVEVKFATELRAGDKQWRHHHVPLLLGPWSYSTYRGS